MIVVVETNFVLEIVINQAEAGECMKILERGHANGLVLAIPSYSIAEAMLKIERRRSERHDVLKSLQPHIRELRRATPLAAYASLITQLSDELLNAEASEATRLRAFIRGSMLAMEVIPLSSSLLLSGSDLSSEPEDEEDEEKEVLSASDAIVCASVLDFLKSRQSVGVEETCFVTRDRDFDTYNLRPALQQFGCRLIFSFADALRFIESRP
jgi:hypothetical protein